MVVVSDKAAGAFRTIGELSHEAGIPQHILRYWETRFPQLRPLQRAGRRRYYRPDDVALVLRISALLDQEGYTIRGVQKLLAAEGKRPSGGDGGGGRSGGSDTRALKAVRDTLVKALRDDQL
ncbi:MAG: MerR family transcriptional regulator [Pseudomonadota bacterium]